jgi:23S rRNA (cytosine1962-C5)-methyltransferase
MAVQNNQVIWYLRKGLDRRFRAGHPWVYSNELTESPKGIEPGTPVELRDSRGNFLARGYGNPQSLIAFRALSRDPAQTHPSSIEAITTTLISSGKLRSQLGLNEFSYRLCYGESDGIPGLVIDRYITEFGQVFVVQAHTAGADQICKDILKILEKYVSQSSGTYSWSQTGVVLRNDISVRKLEGLVENEAKVLKELPKLKLQDSRIRVAPVLGGAPIQFYVDLLEGQKTGFFLDQFSNIQLAAQRFQSISKKQIRILDLCSYVGQWGTQLSRVFREKGIQVEVVAVDASQTALDFARRNIEAEKAKCEILKADVLKNLTSLPAQSFDIVISDPPALIKSRKDIPVGKHAYLQLATQAFRIVQRGGGIVCCSCSALLEEEAFTEVLAKGMLRNQAQVRWVARGSQSPDHPTLMEFPEGRYLKGWIGLVE